MNPCIEIHHAILWAGGHPGGSGMMGIGVESSGTFFELVGKFFRVVYKFTQVGILQPSLKFLVKDFHGVIIHRRKADFHHQPGNPQVIQTCRRKQNPALWVGNVFGLVEKRESPLLFRGKHKGEAPSPKHPGKSKPQ